MQQREINDLSAHIGRLQARNEQLQAEVSDLLGCDLALCLYLWGKALYLDSR